jgi:hypothetical protein
MVVRRREQGKSCDSLSQATSNPAGQNDTPQDTLTPAGLILYTPPIGKLRLNLTYYSTAFAFSLLLYLLPRRRTLRVAFPRPPWHTGQGGQQAYHVPPMYLSGKAASLRRWRNICAGGVRGPRTWPRTFWSKRFSSLRLFLVTTPTMLYLGWPYHSILVPNCLCCWQSQLRLAPWLPSRGPTSP